MGAVIWTGATKKAQTPHAFDFQLRHGNLHCTADQEIALAIHARRNQAPVRFGIFDQDGHQNNFLRIEWRLGDNLAQVRHKLIHIKESLGWLLHGVRSQ